MNATTDTFTTRPAGQSAWVEAYFDLISVRTEWAERAALRALWAARLTARAA
ncbi:MAG TPA: hypothetical protein VMT47_11735 [Polyangia bacterium]|nr:hypothetical protein [Polyangia bacterium]